MRLGDEFEKKAIKERLYGRSVVLQEKPLEGYYPAGESLKVLEEQIDERQERERQKEEAKRAYPVTEGTKELDWRYVTTRTHYTNSGYVEAK